MSYVDKKTVKYWQFYIVCPVIFTNISLKIKEKGKKKQ